MARDHSRLPFQWDGTENAGFSIGTPWIRVHDNYAEVHVAKQEEEKDSVPKFYRKMSRLRKEHTDVFVSGTFKLLNEKNLDTFVYLKRYQEKMALVALNFSTEAQEMPITESVSLLVSTYTETTAGKLQPLEGRIYVNY
jgi:oligo-1,6-glucosidase